MADQTVAATEFQNKVGFYLDQAGKAPVVITRHRRPSRVVLDIDVYERLKQRDTRQAFLIEDIPEDWIEAIANADFSHIDPELDRLLDE